MFNYENDLILDKKEDIYLMKINFKIKVTFCELQ